MQAIFITADGASMTREVSSTHTIRLPLIPRGVPVGHFLPVMVEYFERVYRYSGSADGLLVFREEVNTPEPTYYRSWRRALQDANILRAEIVSLEATLAEIADKAEEITDQADDARLEGEDHG